MQHSPSLPQHQPLQHLEVWKDAKARAVCRLVRPVCCACCCSYQLVAFPGLSFTGRFRGVIELRTLRSSILSRSSARMTLFIFSGLPSTRIVRPLPHPPLRSVSAETSRSFSFRASAAGPNAGVSVVLWSGTAQGDPSTHPSILALPGTRLLTSPVARPVPSVYNVDLSPACLLSRTTSSPGDDEFLRLSQRPRGLRSPAVENAYVPYDVPHQPHGTVAGPLGPLEHAAS